jgi:hypothetical protein
LQDPFKIYPDRDFWLENIASGNPGGQPRGQEDEVVESDPVQIGFNCFSLWPENTCRLVQGFQMVYLHSKNTNLGIFCNALE